MASTARVGGALLLLLLLWSAGRTAPWALALLVVYILWAGLNLWRETTGRGGTSHPVYFMATALLIVALVRNTADGDFMAVLLLQPILMSGAVHGPLTGTLVGAASALGLLIRFVPPGIDPGLLVPAIGALLLGPISTLIARPMAALRLRTELAAELEEQLEPRRGLRTTGLAVAHRLRQATDAHRVLIVHRDAEQPTVLVSDNDDGAYVAGAGMSDRLLRLLAQLPPAPMQFAGARTAGGFLGLDDAPVDRDAVAATLGELATLVEASVLQAVPDAGEPARSTWFLVVHDAARRLGQRPWPLRPLAAFAADIRPMLQLASYADSLQTEIAAHERVRIGRDLHDSALQPYLGLKFAIEGLVLKSAPDNPLYAQIRELQRLCDAELGELRETVSALRVGEARGENTLVPAMRRQARRFTGLFGIEVVLEVADDIVTTRALSGALLHMMNEALSNVRRHTNAQRVWVSLERQSGQLLLTVRDDAGQLNGRPVPAFEPRSLVERARELGGALRHRRHDGLDTEIQITVPI
ncbi:MAG: histidine kinase [Burkholderiaceae bacterium]